MAITTTKSGKTYDELKAECLKDGALFEDPDFPAIDSNIFFSQSAPKAFQWLRPGEILEGSGTSPEFFVGGASRFDVKQGELGDCWLLAALACLSQYPKLMENVIPSSQSFGEGYAGIFKFNFWVFGAWREIVVDDRSTAYLQWQLVFLHSTEKNEFWSSLLEKAYAKLVGSYESLKGGSTSEAFEDFTGGVAEFFDLGPKAPSNLLAIMLKSFERESLMGCSIDAEPTQFESKLSNGLVMGHAYSITSVKMVDIKTANKAGKIPLVRMRNPWGNEAEWKGRWSDQSPEWKLIADDEKEELGLVFDKDGEFWMSFEDFKSNFTKLELCYLSPDTLEDEKIVSSGKVRQKWQMTTMEGSWKKRITAGGCRNYLDTFWTNPQYRFEVIDPDEDDDDDFGTVIIALMQKDRRKFKKEGVDLLTIGYIMYELKDPNCKPLDMRFFKFNESKAKSPNFINLREICGRHKLKPGHYCLIPSTFEPNEEGDFLIRMFSEKTVPSEEIDEKTGLKEPEPEVVAKTTPEDDAATAALKDAFGKISGIDNEIDAYELQEILNSVFQKEFKFDGFCADTCRSLVATKDNGVTVSNQTFNALVMRYSHKDGKIYFDDYIHMIARLSTLFGE
ncbi:hypothetical protein HELRODRAFT_157317 [Helobdella robusta]|uniref:Calpain catalytic domain-containing protein n=1 Tax=Helobdella robusta TaxID=6412 RepID=T1EM95_HELRO|nr:hypothetical protein HELRODRAFT_157317 [Helobdella robusta]ESO00941.1 hypothetical protein HELRODRAFT_157317 [Helobdella robusta]